MKALKTYCLILLSVLCTSCISDVNLEDQLHEKTRIVAYCRLCPQIDTTYIIVTHTQLLYTQNDQTIRILSDATVELSADREQWVHATFSSELNRFFITQAQLPILEGQTYYLRVSADGFDDVTASCTVPYLRETNPHFRFVEAQNDTHWGNTYGQLHTDAYLDWQDFPNEENYYAFYTQENYYAFSGYYFLLLTRDTTEYYYISDKGEDGQMLSYLYDFDCYGTYAEKADDDDDIDDEDEDEVDEYDIDRIGMIQMDKNCYLYEISLNDYDAELSTFLLEPVPTYNNIEGGFGLFGAYVCAPPKKVDQNSFIPRWISRRPHTKSFQSRRPCSTAMHR